PVAPDLDTDAPDLEHEEVLAIHEQVRGVELVHHLLRDGGVVEGRGEEAIDVDIAVGEHRPDLDVADLSGRRAERPDLERRSTADIRGEDTAKPRRRRGRDWRSRVVRFPPHEVVRAHALEAFADRVLVSEPRGPDVR